MNSPPRIRHDVAFASSRGDEALDVAKRAGLIADEHQAEVIRAGCGVDEAGKWAAFEVAVNEPRQNGKGGILEVRELAGLFAWDEGLIVHSAHQVDTSLEHFERMLALIESVPEFDQKVFRVSRTNGREGIALTNGPRLRFRSRSKAGGRGFSCDTLVLDEAMFLPEAFHGALMPTLRARPNPQVWYAGSAVDQEIHENGVVFTRLRERATEGQDRSLVYFEWSLPYESPDEVPPDVAADPEQWRATNPALGSRIQVEHVEKELRALDSRTFAVEILGVGDYPRTDGQVDSVVSAESWSELEDADSVLLDPVCFAFDVSPERRAAIGAAGRNEQGDWHVEVIENWQTTKQLPSRLAELVDAHEPLEVCYDGLGPSSSLIQEIEALGVTLRRLDSREHAQACGRLVDTIAERGLRHPGGAVLWNSIRGAARRPLGDAWAWSRKSSTVNISPLVSVTLALWSAQNEITEEVGELAIY